MFQLVESESMYQIKQQKWTCFSLSKLGLTIRNECCDLNSLFFNFQYKLYLIFNVNVQFFITLN